jgi:hypothetical protein
VNLETAGQYLKKNTRDAVIPPLNDSNRPCWIRDAGRFLYRWPGTTLNAMDVLLMRNTTESPFISIRKQDCYKQIIIVKELKDEVCNGKNYSKHWYFSDIRTGQKNRKNFPDRESRMDSMYNLLHEQWIPVKRKTGEKPEYISPSQVTDGLATNPIIALAAPRPDFNGALIQFLIGLVQTACPPMDVSEWQKKFRSPPSSEELKAAFERYADAFNLDGDGPRFMQDLDLIATVGEQNKIDHLLMEMPGDHTLDKNTDHFLKRDTVRIVCLSCCAMALFTLQTNAPIGGRGHRTSVRGGGPLTTLIMGRTLWETIWINVIIHDSFSHFGNVKKTDGSDMFPWLGHTRTSGKNETTTPQNQYLANSLPTTIIESRPTPFFKQDVSKNLSGRW